MRIKSQERLTQAIFSIVQPHYTDDHIARIIPYRGSGNRNFIQIYKKKENGRSVILVRPDCSVAIMYWEGRIMSYPQLREEWRQEDPGLFERIEELVGPVV